MLAYVFWHWPEPDSVGAPYEASLREFHAALAKEPTAWFHREDWYLLDGSAALDLLDERTVTGLREAAHARIARRAAGGTGGLYRLRLGEPIPARVASWFPKPRGESYDAFYARLRPVVERAGAVLWQRQMVLGPAPEFCVQGRERTALPPALAPITVALEPVWPS